MLRPAQAQAAHLSKGSVSIERQQISYKLGGSIRTSMQLKLEDNCSDHNAAHSAKSHLLVLTVSHAWYTQTGSYPSLARSVLLLQDIDDAQL